MAALGATIVLAMGVGRAISPQRQAVSVRTETSSVGLSAPFCQMSLFAGLRGTRNLRTGVVSGTWSYVAATHCNDKVVGLKVSISASENSSPVATAPPDSCKLCKDVSVSGTIGCSRCNGGWTFTSVHRIDFPLGYLLFQPQNVPCTHTPTSLTCALQTSAWVK